MAMTRKIDGPWHGLSAKRADPTHLFDFYYAVNSEGNLLLVLQFTESVDGQRDLPRLKGVRVQWIGQTNSLQLVLAKGHDDELFALLCRDLLSCTASAPDQFECFDRLCARLLKWQRLLSKGGPRLLDAHEIRGLFAELTFLQSELLPRFGPACVESWKGPSGFPQDFGAGNKVFEIKSHLVGAQQSVRIASPAQLWVDGSDLFLCVYHLAVVASGGKSLGTLVDEIANALTVHATAFEEFEEKLASLGYLDLPDYRSEAFAVVKWDAFEVKGDFPRIVPGGLMAGIQDVTYGIQLAALTPFSATIFWNEA
jgi:Putative  PD-(D/E)XK family member, (DUF4420)